ncbi:hypothetical protein CPB86DRAFT_781666 [Serendipita vermifera]|nr:hypothetical protein CPB86DRAFT_781666 [Serendipita vermifera]
MSSHQLPRRVAINGSFRLPIELIHAIIDFIYGKQELYQLCRTSKLLRSMADGRLYQLYFARSHLAACDIRDFLQHPRFEALINTIHIILRRRQTCVRTTSFGPPCICDILDKDLGKALHGLLNLKTLRLKCYLCKIGPRERHKWLQTLKTRVLQELWFSCQCSPPITKIEKALEYFKAPCMASVINFYYWRISPKFTNHEDPRSLPLDRAILPNMRHFQHGGHTYHEFLLLHHPFTRISATLASITMFNHRDLWNMRGKLTHMSIKFYQVGSDNFFDAIVEDPTPFRNLQHIGTISLAASTCIGRCEELEAMLSRLTALEQLVSFDATFRWRECFPCNEYVEVFEKGLIRLHESFPKLCRAFLETTWGIVDIWVLSGGWKPKGKDCCLEGFDIIGDSEFPRWEVELRRQSSSNDV